MTIEIVYFTDHITLDATRLPMSDIAEMQAQFNCNLSDSEFQEVWFDEEIPVGYTTEIDEDEFFSRYFAE
jgi:hypothetical protein